MEEIIKEGKMSIAALIIRLIIDVFAMIVLVGFVWIVNDLITFFTTNLTIYNNRVTGKKGLVNVSQLDCHISKISGVKVEQGLFDQIFNYGTIRISTSSSTLSFYYIDNPKEIRDLLNQQIEKYSDNNMDKQAQKIADAFKS